MSKKERDRERGEDTEMAQEGKRQDKDEDKQT